MPFSLALPENGLLELVRRFRKNRLAAYGFAIVAVAAAALLRWAFAGVVAEGLPFVTFYPAVVIASLLGGFGPGILALALSSAVAWAAFLPPGVGLALSETTLGALSFFAVLGGMNVLIVSWLSTALKHMLARQNKVMMLIDSAPNGILFVDGAGRIGFANQRMESLFGYTRAELLDKPVEMLLPPDLADLHRSLRQAFMKNPQARPMGAGRDLRGRRKDGTEFPLEIGLNPVTGSGQRGVLATVIDISERKQVQEQQSLLMRELQHRTRNLFAVIQAIAARTLSENRTVSEAKTDLSGRLHALGRAFTLLTESQSEGARLSDLIAQEVAAFSKRLSVSGCEIMVNSAAIQQFALVLHELATNAAKHGSFSVPDGQVLIEGRIENENGEPHFTFLWVESGGPPVAEPVRTGLGTAILLDQMRQFGKPAIHYAKAGVRYELKVRLAQIEIAKPASSGRSAAQAR